MKNFYIISNRAKDPKNLHAERICNYLKKHGANAQYQSCDMLTEERGGGYTDASLIPEETECVIVLGGDGTLLQAARDLNGRDMLLMGVNIGTLGYLTDAGMDSVEIALEKVLAGEFSIDERMMIAGSVYRNGEVVYENTALNDIVINRCGNLRVIDFDVSVNERYLASYSADGVIVSTATGSTAYSLSAGGPIIQPNAELIMVTPICPHTLNKRSLIFGAGDSIEITMSDNKRLSEERIVTFDGEQFFEVITGDRIVVRKSEKITRLVKTSQDNFLQKIREKMS